MKWLMNENKSLFDIQRFRVTRPKRACAKWLSINVLIETPIPALSDRASYSRTRSNKTYKAQDNQIPTAKLRRHPLICPATVKQCVMCTSECIYTYKVLNKSNYVQFEQESKAGSR